MVAAASNCSLYLLNFFVTTFKCLITASLFECKRMSSTRGTSQEIARTMSLWNSGENCQIFGLLFKSIISRSSRSYASPGSKYRASGCIFPRFGTPSDTISSAAIATVVKIELGMRADDWEKLKLKAQRVGDGDGQQRFSWGRRGSGGRGFGESPICL